MPKSAAVEDFLTRLRDVSSLMPKDRLLSKEESQEQIARHVFGDRRTWSAVQSKRVARPNEAVAVSLSNPKTTALFVDRLWDPVLPNGETLLSSPDSIGVHGGTALEFYVASAMAYSTMGISAMRKLLQLPDFSADLKSELAGHLDGLSDLDAVMERAIADRIFGSVANSAIPVYGFLRDREAQYSKGDSAVLIGVIHDLPIPVEESLSWEQVVEVRSDDEARDRLRRLVRWLDSAMVDATAREIADNIQIRLEDYKRALKKHGLATLAGTFERVLDWRALLSKVTALASLAATTGGKLNYGLLGAGSVLLGEVAVSVLRSRLDLGKVHEDHDEIAYVFDLSQRAKA